jgi:hypothetical protein
MGRRYKKLVAIKGRSERTASARSRPLLSIPIWKLLYVLLLLPRRPVRTSSSLYWVLYTCVVPVACVVCIAAAGEIDGRVRTQTGGSHGYWPAQTDCHQEMLLTDQCLCLDWAAYVRCLPAAAVWPKYIYIFFCVIGAVEWIKKKT